MIKEQFIFKDQGLLVHAPAKINLSLLIAGKRDDGFHEIETVMAKIDWYDELFFERSSGAGIELSCHGKYWAPDGQENLVYQACRMILDEAGVKHGLKVTLTKNLPAGAGLGGGSSDAAAALMALNRFLDLGLQDAKLSAIAAELGSDVAFFLGGPLANCCGRGEKISEINQKYAFRAMLLLPDISVSTKRVYGKYTHSQALYERLRREIDRYVEENRIDLLGQMCENMLENSCFVLHPELFELKSRIESLGYGRVCLSGSGSTMYCLVTDFQDDKIEEFRLALKDNVGIDSLIVNSNRW